MEEIFKLTMDEPIENSTHISSTSQILQDCLLIIESPSYDSYKPSNSNNSLTTTTTTTTRRIKNNYSDHPDILYFQKIKQKNHFKFHKSKFQTKWNIDKVNSSKMNSNFDPYDLNSLLLRLKSFNSLNWKSINNSSINELKCAINGWKCVSFGINQIETETETKNHLLCTYCNQQLILKFEDNEDNKVHTNMIESPFDFNVLNGKEIFNDESFQKKLIELYIKQIENIGHDINCLWKNFETPIDQIYYLKHYLPNTNQFLIEQYCKNLKNLIDNILILQEYSDCLKTDLQIINNNNNNNNNNNDFDEFIHISNEWLMAKFFPDNKENFIIGLTYNNILPCWIYQLALYGWSLNVQNYAKDVILVMSCNMCNQRIFLNSHNHNHNHDHDHYEECMISTQLKLSLSKILTPVKYPMSNIGNDNTEFDTIIESSKFDPQIQHKPWCAYLHNNLPIYFYQMLIKSKNNIGPIGDYIYNGNLMDMDMNMDININNTSIDSNQLLTKKRKNSFNVNENLERLNKLRKLYLIDE